MFIVTSGAERSPFLGDLGNIKKLNWSDLRPVEHKKLDIYIVKVGSQESRRRWPKPTYIIRDKLKESGYQWRGEEECWWKSFPVKDFNLEKLKSEKWSREADGVVVQIFGEKNPDCLSSYFINKGEWVLEFDRG